MRNVGLEPTRLAAQEPKSCMSANSISSAHIKLYHPNCSVLSFADVSQQQIVKNPYAQSLHKDLTIRVDRGIRTLGLQSHNLAR